MKVLAVDDDARVLTTLEAMIASLGYSCETAVSGEEALGMIRANHYAIVITDIMMPGMDGMELLREIKRDHPEIDVISMTGYSREYSFTDVIKAGASDFICKPFSRDELDAKVRRIIREQRLKESLIASRNQLMTIFNGIRDWMFTIDHDFRIGLANRAYAEAMGYAEDELVGTVCSELARGQGVVCGEEGFPCPARRALARGTLAVSFHRWRRGDGEEEREITAIPLLDNEGRVQELIIINRDITLRFPGGKRG